MFKDDPYLAYKSLRRVHDASLVSEFRLKSDIILVLFNYIFLNSKIVLFAFIIQNKNKLLYTNKQIDFFIKS